MACPRPPLRCRVRSARGVTLLEAATILTVTLAIVGALVPSVTAVARRAESVVASARMAEINTAILNAMTDLGNAYKRFKTNGQNNGITVTMLVSDGDIPRELLGSGSASWQTAVNTSTGAVDFLEQHLATNVLRVTPFAYPASGANSWRGTYINAPSDPDPWGNRFAVNVQYLDGSSNDEDVVVLSAGPNEVIETAYAVDGLSAGGDDLILLTSSQ